MKGKCSPEMYAQAKMHRVGDLKDKIMKMMAAGHHPDQPMAGGQMAALSAPPASPGMEGSPQEEAAESPAQEQSEIASGTEGQEPDELEQMKQAYFKPGKKPPRPGTAKMLAVSVKASPAPSMAQTQPPSSHDYQGGKPGKKGGFFGRGKNA